MIQHIHDLADEAFQKLFTNRIEPMWKRQNEIAEQLLADDPSIGMIMAVVKDGDMAEEYDVDDFVIAEIEGGA